MCSTFSSYSDVCRSMGWPVNGWGMGKAKTYCRERNIDTTNFGKRDTIYKRIEKPCPVCGVIFTTKKGHPKEKTVCSRSCSNTYFRSGENHGNWKLSAYRSTCFAYHEKKCVICDENRIVEIHHLDEDRNNNDPSNLIPLCPTHHRYWHSRFRNLVEPRILEYLEMWFQTKYSDQAELHPVM